MKPYIILNMSRKHVVMRKTKIKYPWTSLTTSKIRIFAFGIFHISFFKALLINEGERESGRNDPGRIGIGAKRLTGRTGFRAKRPWKIDIYCFSAKHAALRRKSKDWLSRNQDNVSECGNMSITISRLFQWASIIKIQLRMLV